MTERGRLVRIITRLNIGGPARQALLLAKSLSPSFATTLLAGEPQPGEGELGDHEVPIRRVRLVRPLHPAHDLQAYKQICRVLQQTEPVLVHTHMAKAGFLGRAAAGRLRRKPVTVHTFHGHVLEGYFGGAKQRAFIELERWMARQTDALVAVSEEVRDSLLDLGIGTPDQYQVIRLGFDLSALLALQGPDGRLRRRLGLERDVPLVGVLGRLAPIKDHVTLIRAMTKVPDAHLAILGDGELRSALEAEVERQGLSQRVHFVGWWLEVPAAIADVDVVALTSLNEGTPVSLIEAAAGRTPVVATDVGGVRSVVQDGVTGFLVPPKDADAVASRIEALLGSPDVSKAMGDAARPLAKDRFDQRRLVAEVRALYDQLLSDRTAS